MTILNLHQHRKGSMHFQQVARHALVLALAFSFLLSGLVPVTFAQRTTRRSRTEAASPPRRQMRGTEHQRPQRTYDVQHYTIRTRFDVPTKTVYGDTTVSLKPLANGFQTFELDATGMEFESVKLDPEGKVLRWSQAPDKLSITLDRAYSSSDTIAVRIKYKATPEKGLYFIPASPATRYRRYAKPAQIWSQGEPEENHYWFPCYDYPNDKATSEQYITTNANEIAISNGELLETTNNTDGTRTFHYKMDQPHSSYLISMVVGNYTKLTDSYKNIPVEYYTFPGTEAKARSSFGRTPQMIQFFSERFQYEYPYNKYAQTVVSNFIFGGMENITATTQADTEILSGAGDDPSLSVDNLVSHELSHTWFGDLATCKDWANLWVNEGFATFFEAAYKEHAVGRDAYLEEIRSDAASYFSEDSFQYRRPVISNRYQNPVDLFDSTLYKKGGVVVHMLREVVGDEVFWKALNVYLNEFKYQNTDARDLQHVFEKVSGKSLDWFFDQWLYKMGHPVFRVTQDYDQTAKAVKLTIRQEQKPDAESAYPQALFFQTPLDIELGAGNQTTVVRVQLEAKEEQTITIPFDVKPQLVNFDYGGTLIKELKFEKTTDELIYQAARDADMPGRLWALNQLSTRMKENSTTEADKQRIAAALSSALVSDSFWGLRQEAATALNSVPGDVARKALLAATRDKDARVRARAITALANSKDASLADVYLQALKDRSYGVVRAAATALGQTKATQAYGALSSLFDTPSWRDSLRFSAMSGLAELGDKRSLEMGVRYAAKTNPPALRAGAVTLLGTIGKDDARSYQLVADAFTQAVGSGDFNLGATAAEALVALGDQRGLALFEQARKQLPPQAHPFITHFEQRLRQSAAQPTPKTPSQ